MKGFVISIITVSIILLLFTFSSSLRESYLGLERALSSPQPLLYAAFISDNIAATTSSLIGTNISLNESNTSLSISISDTIPGQNYSQTLASYQTFLQGTVANQTHSSISTDFSNMSSGMPGIFINRYNYTNNQTSGEELFIAAGGTNAQSYNITVTVLQARQGVTHFNFNQGGNLNVTITYTDLNGTGSESGALQSGAANSFAITYANGSSLNIIAGMKNGNAGSLWMQAQNVSATTAFVAVLPAMNSTDSQGYSYDGMLNYSQDRITKIRRIGK